MARPVKSLTMGSSETFLSNYNVEKYQIEFLGKPCKELFKKKHIVYKSKIGRNKAFLAEHYIFLVKKYLYLTLRGTLNKNWVEVLEKVVTDMNNTPIKKLGFLSPNPSSGVEEIPWVWMFSGSYGNRDY